jgi:hypothetical protein
MKANHLLIVLVLLAALVLFGCSSKDAPVLGVRQGAQSSYGLPG